MLRMCIILYNDDAVTLVYLCILLLLLILLLVIFLCLFNFFLFLSVILDLLLYMCLVFVYKLLDFYRSPAARDSLLDNISFRINTVSIVIIFNYLTN